MKKYIIITFGLLLFSAEVRAQKTALRTNVLLWLTTTPNVGMEFYLHRHFSFEVTAAYNAWKLPDDMKFNLALVQPELRYWPCRTFDGYFIGLHGHMAHFNVGKIPFILDMKDILYRGNLYGGGISVGYHWAMGRRWGIEASVGAGYTQMSYGKYRCADCAERMGFYKRPYMGPTRAALSLIYFIK